MSRPLFRRYSDLERTLHPVGLVAQPTPVEPMLELARHWRIGDLWIKRDDHSHPAYGGNKVRKLEFLLGDALRRGRDRVMTFGYAGSNHATATAVHAHRVGLRAELILLPQEHTSSIGPNLHTGLVHGARYAFCRSRADVYRTVLARLLADRLRSRQPACRIPPGGSSPLGTVGFVDAAFELAGQVEAGTLPRPDRIYLATSTMGSAVGLAVGLHALGWPTEVHAVRVIGSPYATHRLAWKLARGVARRLRRGARSFPNVDAPSIRLLLRDGFIGSRYGIETREGELAAHALREAGGPKLDGTYAAKALAAVAADGTAGELESRRVLFWNTYNSVPLTARAAASDIAQLPPELRVYIDAAVR